MFCSRTICVGGLPGVGSVGKIAADYLSNCLNCQPVKSFISKGFPPQIMINGNQVMLMQAELKAARDDLFILSGDAQPLEVREMYGLAGEILEYLKSRNVTDVITLAAYVGDSSEKVVAAATDQSLAKELENEGVSLLRNGAIGGINGLLVGLAPMYGLRGLCLLGTTSGEDLIDFRAAKDLLETVKSILGLEVDLNSLSIVEEKGVEEIEPSEDFYISYR